ncbi:potassium channel family protein [Yinghuangia seranimata]|uniref:potassium channel family protein n=1 Tax=Yinghuangia seranimata TaxID=408067 RepID=UPI00248B53F5|nr:potassium channel family protein [Yinghuangia seranimata]MDI2129682.1 potassium channel family protein [Yinghuangia seranimata]
MPPAPAKTVKTEAYLRWERATTPALTALALISLTTFVLGEAMRARGSAILLVEYAVWAVFAVDFLVRLRLSGNRWTFIRTHPLDLAAVALPAMRLMRLISVIGRVGVVARRGRAERLLVSTLAIVLTILVAGAAAVVAPERNDPRANITDFPDALWWAISTVTTVGYGDLHPVTPEGRLVGAILMVVGIGMMGVVTATIATRIILPEQQAEERAEMADLDARLEARLDAIDRRLDAILDRLDDTAPDRKRPARALGAEGESSHDNTHGMNEANLHEARNSA